VTTAVAKTVSPVLVQLQHQRVLFAFMYNSATLHLQVIYLRWYLFETKYELEQVCNGVWRGCTSDTYAEEAFKIVYDGTAFVTETCYPPKTDTANGITSVQVMNINS
jgi:hypothetical protein